MQVRVNGIIKYTLNDDDKYLPVDSEHNVLTLETAKDELLDKHRQVIEQTHINDPLDSVRDFKWTLFESSPLGEDELMRRAGMPTLPGLE